MGTALFTRFLERAGEMALQHDRPACGRRQLPDYGNSRLARRGCGAIIGGTGRCASAGGSAFLALRSEPKLYTLASSDAFMLIAWAIVGYLILLVFLRPSTINLRHVGNTK